MNIIHISTYLKFLRLNSKCFVPGWHLNSNYSRFAMFKFAEISRHASQDARISIDDGDDGDDADDGADVDDTREYKIKFIRFAWVFITKRLWLFGIDIWLISLSGSVVIPHHLCKTSTMKIIKRKRIGTHGKVAKKSAEMYSHRSGQKTWCK